MSAARPVPTWRGDIDGLRALAVVPVVLFHAGVRGFSGGFVGVDVFFVISGYLITGILAREAAGGTFSIAGFYRRRVLRIFPALAVMMAATWLAALVWLLPSEWPLYQRGLAATALFGANIVFYGATDYFNAGATAQPLLHCWSLGVEEQWYLVWPLLVAALVRRPHALRLVTVGIAGLSLLVAAWWLPHDQPAVFYLLPFRAWELGLGAILALRVAPTARRSPRLAALLGLVGLALIAAPVKLYTAVTPFPGLAAVPPCLGAALLLDSGRVPNPVARALAWAPLRWIGLISFSLYLWHWPILVFAETGLGLGHAPLALAGEVGVAVAVAALSWWLVEQPVRRAGVRWSTPAVLGAGVAMIAAMLALAAVVPTLAARVAPLSPDQTRLAGWLAWDGDGAYRRGQCFVVTATNRFDAGSCLAETGKPVIALVGDSFAAQLWPGLARWRDRFDVLQATATECLARRYPDQRPAKCAATVEHVLHAWLLTHHPRRLILASRWQAGRLDGLEATLADPLVHAAHPLLVGPLPEYDTALPRLLVRARQWQAPALVDRARSEAPFAVERDLRAIAARTGTPYLSWLDLLCDAAHRCRVEAAPGVPLQFDTAHLTAPGAVLLTDLAAAQLQGSTTAR